MDLNALESSLDDTLKETESLKTQIQERIIQIVPQIDPRTQAAQDLRNDGTAKEYIQHRTRRTYLLTTSLLLELLTYPCKENLQNPLGSSIARHYEPHHLLTNPPSPSDITLELLLASQAHLGHKTSHWNPMNSRYIFGIRQGIHIISLDVTAAHLRRACRVVSGVAEKGGLVLFVGTRPGQDRCVVKAAQMAGGCHLFERWTPGSITNGHQILGTCRMKVVDEFDREIPGFEEELQDRPVLRPDLVVCLNPMENHVMLHECGLNSIPTIGIVDTDANPTWVTYPIPANDDSLRCVQVIAGVLGRAGQEGQERRKELAHAGNVTYSPAVFGSAMPTKGARGARMGGSGNNIRASQL